MEKKCAVGHSFAHSATFAQHCTASFSFALWSGEAAQAVVYGGACTESRVRLSLSQTLLRASIVVPSLDDALLFD